jgi:hypothetical protein
MTPIRATSFRSHIVAWINDLKKLHPHANHHTYHHLAVHIYDFLLLFGPVQSWWCFPFERLIGLLQRLPHNHKFGEPPFTITGPALSNHNLRLGQLESRLTEAFMQGARLRRWIGRSDSPPAIQECKVLFQKAYGSDPRQSVDGGNDEGDLEEKQEVSTPTTLQTVVKSKNVVLRARFKHLGVVYARSSTHLGNSLIMYYPGVSKSSAPVPGSIQHIFEREGKTVFAVKRYLRKQPNVIDPFSSYPDFPAQLWSSEMTDELELVDPDSIFCHFACRKWNAGHVVVLSLPKVCTEQ